MILYVGNTNSSVQKQLVGVKHFCFEPTGKRKGHLPTSDCKILLDSGAFADVKKERLSFPNALERQLEYERHNGFISERIVSYDTLIDEQLQGDRQIKERWNEKTGWGAVKTTLAAAEFLSSHRKSLAPRQLVLSCQGVTAEQYIACMKDLLQIAKPQDCIGLGGWCIVGQQRHLAGLFWDVMNICLPLIAEKCKDVHVFGLSWFPLVREFAVRCRELGLNASNDTSRFYFELSRGKMFFPEDGRSLYVRADLTPAIGFHSSQMRSRRNLAADTELAIRNIETAYRFVQDIENWKPSDALF